MKGFFIDCSCFWIRSAAGVNIYPLSLTSRREFRVGRCWYTAMLAVVLSMSIQPPAAAQWQGAQIDTLTRDTFRDEITQQSLAVDVVNTRHAVWQRANNIGGWRIFYSRKEVFSIWQPAREVADSALMCFDPALAVEKSSGRPFITYVGSLGLSDEIFLAKDSVGNWLTERITLNGTRDLAPTIVIEELGKVHIAWIGQDTAHNWKIHYATNRTGSWQIQLLAGSELGPFGSGAAPVIVVAANGTAHIFYRGGDFGTYHIHHATNAIPGGTVWSFEIVTTPNANDFTTQSVITSDGAIHLLASGNDGWGFPVQAYYLSKPEGGGWTMPQHTNPGGSGWGTSLFIDEYGKAHIAWTETSGNFYAGNLHYATNRSGVWRIAPILTDGKTYGGALILYGFGIGYVLAYNGDTFAAQEIIGVNSQGSLSLVSKEARQPARFELEQNYPNPFNPITNFQFSISNLQFVSLKIFDVLGREVATLVNEMKPPGTHRFSWNAGNLPSGVYFYRLTAGTFSDTKRLILLK